jgi:hypothetical protein
MNQIKKEIARGTREADEDVGSDPDTFTCQFRPLHPLGSL